MLIAHVVPILGRQVILLFVDDLHRINKDRWAINHTRMGVMPQP